MVLWLVFVKQERGGEVEFNVEELCEDQESQKTIS